MCGAPSCPNNPDGDGVGNWDVFDGLIVANANDHQALVAAMVLLRRIAEGELTPDDPDEQGRHFRNLEEAALLVVKQLSFLPPSRANLRTWTEELEKP
jgi:hypothetical protein